MSKNANPLVYSTDSHESLPCNTCGKAPCVCAGSVEIDPAKTVLKLSLDKKGRKGKAVTLVFELPHNPDYFSDLAKKLKSHCGTGGGMKNGIIEIQGDQRDRVQVFLEKIGFTIRRAGG